MATTDYDAPRRSTVEDANTESLDAITNRPRVSLVAVNGIWSSRCAPRGLQRICCFLTIRLLITWLTADSTNEVEMISPAR